MIVPDLNLLVYAHADGMPLHEGARRWWEDLVNGSERIGVPWIVTAGFVRLLTHPSLLTDPAPPAAAVEFVREWFGAPTVTALNPGAQYLEIFGRLLGDAGVGANLVTGAHIAALAIEHQAEVHSNDTDFARFAGLRWRNPL
ncbi:type II toxin-antitoxin system VapC family toxin [Candidatus Poriferisodalis sp.]|uniref:type II toxin-antitoxin system VapC family toxin n=1 Tax=Candidatus Poriferisodalis sp. TaxID=3101277 RepID=UPI003B5CE352